MKTYLVSDNHYSWEVEAADANKAVEKSYAGNGGCALLVSAKGGNEGGNAEWYAVLYALVDADGEDHSSWAPNNRGPIESDWIPVWQSQG